MSRHRKEGSHIKRAIWKTGNASEEWIPGKSSSTTSRSVGDPHATASQLASRAARRGQLTVHAQLPVSSGKELVRQSHEFVVTLYVTPEVRNRFETEPGSGQGTRHRRDCVGVASDPEGTDDHVVERLA
jgi:hypothetical protein